MSQVTPKCPYFARCGGCQHQDKSYEQQIKQKQEFLRVLYGQEVPIQAQDEPYNYRNRMDFVTTPQGVGLRGESWKDVVDVKECVIANQAINQALSTVREWVEQHGIPLYDLQKHTGFLRQVMIRAQTQTQVTLVTADKRFKEEVALLAQQLQATSVVWCINNTQSNDSLGEQHRVYGEETITLQLLDKEFVIDPYTFFQTSPCMAQQAITAMKEHVPQGVVVHDLYCGVGVLGQTVAQRVVGVDNNPANIARAKQNAALNDVQATYHCADAAAWLQSQQPTIVIVDPPRAGLGVGAQTLLAAKPQTILYLSCNPKTQQRDLAYLTRDYKVTRLQAFDFFAHTNHVEVLAVLTRK